MTDEEFVELYQGLLQILRQTDTPFLNQIADRVEAVVDEGKIVKNKVQIGVDDNTNSSLSTREYQTRKTTRTLYRREDYPPKERLSLVLDAIEAALVNPSLIRERTAQLFADEAKFTGLNQEDIELYQGVVDNESPIVLATDSANTEIGQIQQLRTVISRIRAEMNNGSH